MKIDVKYTGNIINLPAACADFAEKATKEDFVVIINLLRYNNYFDGFENFIVEFSSKINMNIEKVKTSLKFWQNAGVLEIDSFGSLDTNMVTDTFSNAVPTYTGAQISQFIEKNKEIATLFYNCQSIMGKEFNAHDHNNIIYLKSYYKFDDDFIMLLIAHCVELDKANWEYIRKTAKNLYDTGVDTYRKLERHFEDRKNNNSLEFKIRKLFGMGDREFTKAEKEVISKWINMEIDINLLQKAYEITVDKTGKSSLKYTAKIIENWNSNGIKTVEQAEEAQNKHKEKMSMSTFDTNDFFEAALKRSYEEFYKEDK
jgi:DnaD/phage-associated family protein